MAALDHKVYVDQVDQKETLVMSENLVLMEIKEYKDLREFLGLQVKVATLDSPATREILAGQEVRGPVEKMENQELSVLLVYLVRLEKLDQLENLGLQVQVELQVCLEIGV